MPADASPLRRAIFAFARVRAASTRGWRWTRRRRARCPAPRHATGSVPRGRLVLRRRAGPPRRDCVPPPRAAPRAPRPARADRARGSSSGVPASPARSSCSPIVPLEDASSWRGLPAEGNRRTAGTRPAAASTRRSLLAGQLIAPGVPEAVGGAEVGLAAKPRGGLHLTAERQHAVHGLVAEDDGIR
jgi:hypothetical protein